MKCSLTGKRALRGYNVSKAYNHVIKWQKANVQKKRIFDEELQRYVRVKISNKALRTVNKLGLSAYLRKLGISLKTVEIKDLKEPEKIKSNRSICRRGKPKNNNGK